MRIQLLLPSEIKSSEKILKAVEESEGGSVGIPDLILTKNMLKASEELDDFSKEWRKKYDFHLAEFQIVIDPRADYKPEWVNIACALNPWNPVLSRPIAKNVFPSTEFVDANWKISGEFGVSASLGFSKLPKVGDIIEGEAKGEAKLEFKYEPKIARIDSGTAGSNFHWNFRKASGAFPTGGLDLKAVIMRPREVEQIEAFFEIGVKFDRKRRPLGWGDDLARAAAKSPVKFTKSPL